MLNLFDYELAKKIKLIDDEDMEWVGNVKGIDRAENNESGHNSIVIEPDSGYKFAGQLVEFEEQEIKSIEIVEE